MKHTYLSPKYGFIILLLACLSLQHAKAQDTVCVGSPAIFYPSCLGDFVITIQGGTGYADADGAWVTWGGVGTGHLVFLDNSVRPREVACEIFVNIVGAPTGGTTSGGGQICTGGSAHIYLNSGSYTGNIDHWESSTDGGNWSYISSTSSDIYPSSISQTTYYRAIISQCSSTAASSVSTITTKSADPIYIGASGNMNPCSGVSEVTFTVATDDPVWSNARVWKETFTNGSWGNQQVIGGVKIDTPTLSYGVSSESPFRIWATYNNSLCSSTISSGFIYGGTPSIPPPQTATISGPDLVCLGTPISLSVQNVVGTVQTWFRRRYGSNGEVISYSEIGSAPTNFAMNEKNDFVVRISRNSECAPAYDEITKQVDVIPVVTGGTLSSSSSARICRSGSRNLTLSNSYGYIERWESSTDGAYWPSERYVTSNHTTGLGTGTLTQTTYYRALLSSCSNIAYSSVLPVYVDNPAEVLVTPDKDLNYCVSQEVTLTASAENETLGNLRFEQSVFSNGVWSEFVAVPGGSQQAGFISGVVLTGLTRFRARYTHPTCGFIYTAEEHYISGGPYTPNVSVSINGPASVCPDAPFALSANVTNAAVTDWTIQNSHHNGQPTNLQNISSVLITEPSTFTVNVVNAACNITASQSITVSIKPVPTGTLTTSSQKLCYDQDLSFVITNSANTSSFQWQKLNGEGWDNIATTSVANKTFTETQSSGVWRAVLTGECTATTGSVNIEVAPQIATPVVSSIEICQESALTLAVANPPIDKMTTYKWKKSSGGTDTYIETSENSLPLQNFSSGEIYSVAFVNRGCEGQRVTIPIAYLPSAPPPADPTLLVTVDPAYNISVYKNNASTSSLTYFWQTSSGGTETNNAANTLTNPSSGFYYVRGKSTSGCWGPVSQPVEVINQNPVSVTYPSTELNQVKTYSFLQPSTTVSFSTNRDTEDATKLTTANAYFDGLGRPLQTVVKKATPAQADLVSPVGYDEAGRKIHDHLPYATGSDGSLKSNPFVSQQMYYQNTSSVANSSFPFTYNKIERSPLDRTQASFATGEAWAGYAGSTDVTKDRSTKVSYEFNKAQEVLFFGYDPVSGTCTISAQVGNKYYPANKLVANRTLDEMNNETITFADNEGRMVCKKVQYGTSGSTKLYTETYYLYDDFGNLTLVLPPEAVKKIVSQF